MNDIVINKIQLIFPPPPAGYVGEAGGDLFELQRITVEPAHFQRIVKPLRGSGCSPSLSAFPLHIR